VLLHLGDGANIAFDGGLRVSVGSCGAGLHGL
jgi:hypothetical protein